MTPRSLFNSPNLPQVPSSSSLSAKGLLPFLDAVDLPHDRVHSTLNLIEETIVAIRQLPHEGYCRAVRFAFEGYVHPDDVPDELTTPEARDTLAEWLIGSDSAKALRPEAVAYILWRIARSRAAVDADVLAKHLYSLAATVHFMASLPSTKTVPNTPPTPSTTKKAVGNPST